jgi:RimJ/RimL family protein N-acetyltransferase
VRQDSAALLVLHNDPGNRDFTAEPSVVTDELEHNIWYEEKYFTGGVDRCYVLVVDWKVVGVCRIDHRRGDVYEVSITIDSACHGMGYGTILLPSAIALFRSDKKYARLEAVIHKGNAASRKLFLKNGFTLSDKPCEVGSDYEGYNRWIVD